MNREGAKTRVEVATGSLFYVKESAESIMTNIERGHVWITVTLRCATEVKMQVSQLVSLMELDYGN